MFDQFLDLAVLGIDVGTLEDPWQEARLPVLAFLDRVAAGAHGDETRQVEIFSAEAVGYPGTHARPDLARISTVQQQQGRLVVGNIRVH